MGHRVPAAGDVLAANAEIVLRALVPRLGAIDAASRSLTLSQSHTRVLPQDPLILTLARGDYCPKEHQQHLELAANYPKIAVAYTKIATISTDTHHSSQEFRASIGAQWPFLSDPERTVQKDLDIVLKPGLREAWAAGDYSPFQGWDKRAPQSATSSYAS